MATNPVDLGTIVVTGSKINQSSLAGFLSSFRTDIARPNKFDVEIPAPPLLAAYSKNFGDLRYRCETAQLPSRTFGTVEQKFGSNPTQKTPMHSSYNDLQFTFIVSGSMQEKTLFDIWMEAINPTQSFNFSYKEDYAVDIAVIQYDLTNNTTYLARFLNAYPVAVNQLDLDWSSEGHHKLTVDFAYDYWTNKRVVQAITPNSSTP
jgi:hypothetical protein